MTRTKHGASQQTWTPTVPTHVTWLQNEAGARMWPVTDHNKRALLDAFCGR